jgi:hypothetical protein
MNNHTINALRIALTEATQKKENLLSMAEQYEKRAKTIREQEVPETEEIIRQIMADLGN